MSKRLAVLIAAAILPALTFAAPAQAQAKQYPYRLVDPGTFGGPGSFVDLPGVPITSNGTVIGTADTITPDSDRPASHCDAFCDGYVQHAFAWRSGRLADLGALAPAAQNNSAVYGLNGNGVGTGESENGRIDPLTGSPSQEATVFEHGRVIGLGTLGGHESGGGPINSHGQVTGFSTISTRDPFPSELQRYYLPFVDEIRGFVWRDGVMRDLGTLGGPDAFPLFQNQRGQIAGWSDTNWRLHAATGAPTIDPFLWQHGRMTDLGTLGGRLGMASWLNDKGEVVGVSDLKGDHNAHPFLWRHGKMIDLGTPDGNYGTASYVNQRGDVTGNYFASDGNFHGVLWHHGKMTDLPPVGGAPWAFGNAVNNRDQVVGNQTDTNFNEVSAALWTGGHGYDLNTLVAPSDFQMISADYITNRGEIFGHGFYTSGPSAGDARVFVLIRNPAVPLPPASTPARPRPAITGPPDRSISVVLALRAAHRGSVSVPSARH